MAPPAMDSSRHGDELAAAGFPCREIGRHPWRGGWLRTGGYLVVVRAKTVRSDCALPAAHDVAASVNRILRRRCAGQSGCSLAAITCPDHACRGNALRPLAAAFGGVRRVMVFCDSRAELERRAPRE